MWKDIIHYTLITMAIFVAGYIVGFANKKFLDEELNKGRRINPDKLIAWLENYLYNYEYVAPPTTGEIIAKIQEMAENSDDEEY